MHKTSSTHTNSGMRFYLLPAPFEIKFRRFIEKLPFYGFLLISSIFFIKLIKCHKIWICKLFFGIFIDFLTFFDILSIHRYWGNDRFPVIKRPEIIFGGRENRKSKLGNLRLFCNFVDFEPRTRTPTHLLSRFFWYFLPTFWPKAGKFAVFWSQFFKNGSNRMSPQNRFNFDQKMRQNRKVWFLKKTIILINFDKKIDIFLIFWHFF